MALQLQAAERTRLLTPSRALQLLPTIAAVLDFAIIAVVAMTAAAARRTAGLFPASADVDLQILGPLIVLGWVFAIYRQRGYSRGVFEVGTEEFRRVAMASLTAGGLLGVACYLFHVSLSRGFFFLLFVIGLPGLMAGRMLLRVGVQQLRRRGSLQHHVLIAGSTRSIDEVAAVLQRSPRLGYQIVGALASDRSAGDETAAGIPVLGGVEEITGSLTTSGVDIVFLANGAVDSADEMQTIAYELEHRAVQVVVAPSVSDVSGDRVRVRPVGGLPLIHIDPPRALDAVRWGKRLFDVAGAAMLLLVVTPVLIYGMLWVKLHDRGPVLFNQERVGRDGVVFHCLKLRSMVVDAEQQLARLVADASSGEGLFKMKEDPRVTRPGRWLRRFSIDEMPQLVNVLRGDMSLVGPRPPLPAEVALYSKRARRRLQVRPGLTGLWQVSGRSDLSYDEAIRLDVYYVDNWSMFQDLSILLKTIGAVARARGAY